MTALQNIVFETDDVEISKGSNLPLRGISANGISSLWQRYSAEITEIFGKFASKAAQGQSIDVGEELIVGVPFLTAAIIALASGSRPNDKVNWDIDLARAMDIPMDTQIEAIQKIANLTFRSDDSVKKFGGLLLRLVTTNLPSPDGQAI